jgi:hypothetical protein
VDPAALLREPLFARRGVLAWPDAWDNWVGPGAYEALGLDPAGAKAGAAR